MADYPTFICAYEKDHNPPLDVQAERWFQQARHLERAMGPWPEVERLYQQAVTKDHWKAMHNLANLYRTGFPGEPGIEKNKQKMLDLYERMVELKVPLGYYNWAVTAERGNGVLQSDRMASSHMFQAAQLGSSLAQVAIGSFFAFGLPMKQQDNEMAEQYYRCAGEQENTYALRKVGSFYSVAKNNHPRALYYYQRAGALGSSDAFNILAMAFDPDGNGFGFGYTPDKNLSDFYLELYYKAEADPDWRYPNLIEEHPLPKHPSQGYDAEHPERPFRL
ncbi:tetratricopeptide repeat protein [Pseudomonas sp. Marseille-Q8238]